MISKAQNKSGKILIRTDASIQIGTGHVMRCLTLADELRGADVIFVCREFAGNLCGYIEEKGYAVHRLPVSDAPEQDVETNLKHSAWLGADWQADAGQVEEIIKDLDTLPDWLVVDHYALDERWEGYLRPYCKKIMVIDDLADRVHDCDLLLDQNFYDNLERRYDGLVPAWCKKLLGPKYALLRPEFREARKNLRKRDGHVKRIMIFFGGSDPTNETSKALEAVRLLNRPDIAVDVVVGSANPNKDQINELCAVMMDVTYHCQISNMAMIMSDADLFIGAGGSTTWERCCLGLPSLVVTLADNQVGIAKGLEKAGAGIDLGRYENFSVKQYTQALKDILQNKNKMLCLSEQGQRLVNGKGIQKIVRAMIVGQIKLHKVQDQDCKLLWEWVNDVDVRQSAFNSKNIAWDDHRTWFLNKRKAPDCFQYIALNNHDIPIGQIRFDIKNFVAEIDYSIDKNFRGMGLGKILIKQGIESFCAEVEKPITIQGCVKKENQPSNQIFQRLGFLKNAEKNVDKNQCSTNKQTNNIYQLRFFPKEKAG